MAVRKVCWTPARARSMGLDLDQGVKMDVFGSRGLRGSSFFSFRLPLLPPSCSGKAIHSNDESAWWSLPDGRADPHPLDQRVCQRGGGMIKDVGRDAGFEGSDLEFRVQLLVAFTFSSDME